MFVCQQLQEQLDAVDAAFNLCPPRLKLGLRKVQQQVVERWEELRDYAEQRGEELKLAYQRYLFINTVKTPLLFLFYSFILKYLLFLFFCLILLLYSKLFKCTKQGTIL